jgi:hypothetical protein
MRTSTNRWASRSVVAALGLALLAAPAAARATEAQPTRTVAGAVPADPIKHCPACWETIPNGS